VRREEKRQLALAVGRAFGKAAQIAVQIVEIGFQIV
jgi:hypothetical protein